MPLENSVFLMKLLCFFLSQGMIINFSGFLFILSLDHVLFVVYICICSFFGTCNHICDFVVYSSNNMC